MLPFPKRRGSELPPKKYPHFLRTPDTTASGPKLAGKVEGFPKMIKGTFLAVLMKGCLSILGPILESPLWGERSDSAW